MNMLSILALIPLAISPALADVITKVPDAAPAGYEEWTSPIVLPAPDVKGQGDWAFPVARAKAFVAKMTLEEKVNITTGQGLFGRCVGNTGSIPRLGYDGLCLQDGPIGVRFQNNASVFPAAINAAATWDKDLMYQRAHAMGEEFRGKGVNVALAPMMNMGRVAAGGRNWEGFGGDPFLSGVAVAEHVKGIQDVGVIACAKHFIANEQEHFRGGSLSSQVESSNVDDKAMHELYSWPFAEAVQAGVASYMCSYNKVNQTQACQNSKMINGLLKEELNFQGLIMSDWAAMIEGVQPALAGLDLNMPGFPAYGQGEQNLPLPVNASNSFWGAALVTAVTNGSVPVSRLNDMVTRQLAAFYKLGQDHGYPKVNFDVNHRPGLDLNVNVQGDHFKVIREIGAASTVLLKNTAKALPLSVNKIKNLGVFGADAGPNPAGPNSCSDRGCDIGTLAGGWGSGTANFPYLVDPLAAITSFVQKSKKNVKVQSVLNEFDSAQVIAVAKQSDTCLVFSNADSGEGYINVDGNQGDRNNLTLWNSGESLIKTTADNCNNTIVVLHIVGPIITEDWINHPNVKAVLHAGIPGQESGNAIVDVLFGAVNPSGRLPYTIAKQRSDYSADVVYTSDMQTPQIVYSEGVNIDYKWFDLKNIAPRFEFGFGLSYTTFSYSGLKISGPHPTGLWNTAVTVSYAIKNSGSVDGSEVSQVYLGFPSGTETAPRQLRGFDKSLIYHGSTCFVTVTLRQKDISVWDVISQKWVVPSGQFKVFVGSSSRDIRLTGSFHA